MNNTVVDGPKPQGAGKGEPDPRPLLSPSEQRVAELAASGLTNRDIGAAVFISPKTVEANLARIYRKLGIHTRAELGRVVGQQTEQETARLLRWGEGPTCGREGDCSVKPIGSLLAMLNQLSTDVIGRSVEFGALAKFLQSAGVQPSGLVIEGEAGIGKTTLWLAAVEQAANTDFRVLSARVGQNETVLAYATLADLLGGVGPAILARLPGVQRDRGRPRAAARRQRRLADQPASGRRRARLRGARHGCGGPGLGRHRRCAVAGRISHAVVAFAARRFKRRVGVLVTERVDAENGSASWLQLAEPDVVDRIGVGPLSQGDLHTLICTRLGQSLSRPTMVRIADVSGGNPFYALELARAMDAAGTTSEVLPATLAELMRIRVGHLDRQAQDVLLAAACVANPTVELLAMATDNTVDRIVELLDEPESNGVVGIEGNRVRFAHPLLARSVFTEASPGRRRAIHRSLANALALPELKARHTALAAASADPETLQALDAAAAAARARGAPAAAAELVELAIGLGGDTPSRRIRAAEHHFKSGDADRARALAGIDDRSLASRTASEHRTELAGRHPHLRRRLRRRCRPLETCARRRGPQSSRVGPDPHVVGLRAGDVR